RDEIELYKQSKELNWGIVNGKEFLPGSYAGERSRLNNSLFYFENDTAGYMVFNGRFSNPMPKASGYTFSKEKHVGEIVAGMLTDHGYFLIQKTGPKQYFININNSVYRELDNIDFLLMDNFYFNKNELIFFGV